MRKKVGLLGGTFDPIHCGHLHLAFELMEKKNLDEVWFIPAQVNPFKEEAPPISIQHRLSMVRLAIQDIPFFHLQSLESERPPPSYTIHTLQEFIKQEIHQPFPNQFFLLMGEDSIPGFMQWHLPEEIVQLMPLYIGSRTGVWQKAELTDFSLSVREAIQKGITPTALMDVSGTTIRTRLSQRQYCGHLVCAPVLDYIEKNRLYN